MTIPAGVDLKINYRVRIENKTIGNATFFFETLDAALFPVNIVYVTANTGGIYESSVILSNPDPGGEYLSIAFENGGGGPTWDMYVEEISFGDPTTEEVELPAVTVTEEICIDIIDQCEVGEGIVQGNRRLLEDGGYRLLE